MTNHPFCIYAVDDDEDDRVLIKAALNQYSDCEVTFFANGTELLTTLLATPEDKLPTLLLLDLDLPGMNGFDVLKAIRAKPTLRAIPVLVLSGLRNEPSVQAAYELGANSFMSKPSTFAEMAQMFKLTYDYWLKTAHTPANP